MRRKVLGTFRYVIIICRLTAAKLGRRERSLLHLDGDRDLWDPIFFHAAQGIAATKKSVLRR